MSTTRRKHSPAFKGQVALEALKEQQTIAQVASQFQVHPTQVKQWRDQLKEQIPSVFSEGTSKQLEAKEQLIEQLYRQVGKVSTELDWLKKKMGHTSE